MAQLNEILQSINKEEKEVDQQVANYISFLRQCGAPPATERRVLRWMRFYYTEEVTSRQQREILADPNLPDEFRLALAEGLQGDLFHNVPFLIGMIPRIKSEFSAQLMLTGVTRYFERDAELANHKASADCMFIIVKGQVEVRLPNAGSFLRILQRGDIFGDSALVGDERWAGSTGISATFTATTKCCVMVFPIDAIR
eukprot:CAMPEP_0113668528 /NCGR_PEP_ID=MMETSP0038_2-20120614/4054_1 /TAXON_ID=2898 /ORGANISM="Cryptomonas paramecium" /LENGTH=197 /DNA_ID=CAMNT_0000584289 /DNA_START=188 /DNA_END=778 /DNA_ORIENTATION=+ /assembly_acc=CAM_ASM_000170